MDESGVDMGFDLAALTSDLEENIAGNHQHANINDYNDDLEQTLSLLSSSTGDFMYYELKSRAPYTGRCVCRYRRH